MSTEVTVVCAGPGHAGGRVRKLEMFTVDGETVARRFVMRPDQYTRAMRRGYGIAPESDPWRDLDGAAIAPGPLADSMEGVVDRAPSCKLCGRRMPPDSATFRAVVARHAADGHAIITLTELVAKMANQEKR